MDTPKLLEEVKKEIARLQKVEALLEEKPPSRKGRGKGKRKLNAAARKKIGDAQRARWAKVKREKKLPRKHPDRTTSPMAARLNCYYLRINFRT
jgi:hypothetical protein